jgi:hypothetical protein
MKYSAKSFAWLAAAGFLGAGASALASGLIPKSPQSPYQGSSFRQIRALVFDTDDVRSDDPRAEAEREAYRRGELPEWPVSWTTIWRRTRNGLVNLLAIRAKATLNEYPDYYDRLEKVVHPTGICFAGEWRITEPTPYDGYFATGADGLLIGRASSASGVNTAGHKRPFGFAGKIFPTRDPDQVVETINFVTVDNLAGTLAPHYLDTSLTNAPPTGFVFVPVKTLEVFFALSGADRHITSRPVEQIARWGADKGADVRTPRWMLLRAAPGTPRVDEADFRRELDVSRYPAGIALDIFASDTTRDPAATSGWARVGRITLRESKVSYACDRQLHFHHERAGR